MGHFTLTSISNYRPCCRYEQGRNLAYDGLPVNAALSMGVHESQSLLWERMVALSLPFAKYLRVSTRVDCECQHPNITVIPA